MKLHLAAIAAALSVASVASHAQQQGVTKDEILVGSIQDLSGPIAAYGKAVRQGMLLRVEEANEQGGVHGRKLKLLVEDDGYDPKKAVLAAQKLVNQDKVFIVAGHIGTAQNNAAMPVQFEKNIINFLPITAAREMYEPFNRLKYSFAATYYDQIRTSLPKMVKDKGAKKVCAIYQDDEFGLEVVRGAEAGLKSMNMELAEKSSFKRGSTDFSSQVARNKAAGCEMVVLSACETGLGKVAGGQGVLGLQRAFAVAGARSTLTSLWQVPDDATKELMIRFYTNLWNGKMSRIEALRQAQLWLLRKGRADAGISRAMRPVDRIDAPKDGRLPPYYWAAFVLAGDWR